jgi:WS/DGAT/MGAT family acyltransferase
MLLNLFGSGRESMSAVDTAWLRMDRPTNLMVITGIMFFDGRIDDDAFRKVLETRLLRHRRFRQRVHRTGTSAAWEDDPDFALDNHLHLVALPGRAGKSELEKMVNDLISTPMDFSKPLWQFYLVENYQGGSALIARIHHCIADGIALIQVLLSLTDRAADGHAAEPTPKRLKFVAGESDDDDDLFMRLYKPAAKMYVGMLKSYFKLLGTGYGLVTNPGALARYTQTGFGIAQGLAKLAALPADPKTKFKGKLSTTKRVAWSESLPLAEIKPICKVLGCSINDALMSCLAGALRGYLIEHGDDVRGLDIRASVPVNLRPQNKLDQLGNYFGLVFMSLPLGIENPIERVYEVRRRMEEIKRSYDAVITLGLLAVVGSLPEMIETPAVDFFSTKSTTVMTNVPGPREPIYLAGTAVADLQFWVPQSGEIGMGVSILSYNNRVNFGVMADKRLVPVPGDLVTRFGREFEKLVLATLLHAVDGPPDAEAAALHMAIWERIACG